MMTQLVVHAHDEESDSFGPVYTVCILERGILVRAIRRAWTNTARAVEEALNRSRVVAREDVPRPIGSTTGHSPADDHIVPEGGWRWPSQENGSCS